MEIKIENLTKKYKDKLALSNIDLTLPEGSFTAILGPSGCGKTTLMRSIAGFLEINSGTIKFGDQDVTHLPPQKRGTAMVFQNYALWPHMTVFENIAYGLKLRKVEKKELEKRVYSVLEKVEIDNTDIRKRRPTEYSGGQQQRIALARALVLEPKLLLMDEPLSNLDAKVRQRLRVEIRNLQKDLGITAIYVTHDQEEALSMADQVVLMNKGEIVQVGSPEDLYNDPARYFVSHFLGNSNTIKISRENDKWMIGSQVISLPENVLRRKGNTDDYLLVIRGEEIKLASTAANDTNIVSVKGQLKESLFVGAEYRHFVIVEDQNLFVHSDTKTLDYGECYLHIPHDKCFVFPSEEQLED